MTVRLFGIPACDTVKKARIWLAQAGVVYEFVDLRAPPIAAEEVARWFAALGPALINTRSTTYRQLTPQEREAISQGDCLAVLQRHPTLIKRPVLHTQQKFICGFDATAYQSLFLNN